jgi:hypothetical protein
MRKIVFSIALLSLLVLTACATNDAIPNFASTSTPIAPPSASTAVKEIVGAKPGECQVAPSILPPEKAKEWQTYAPISANDYVKGPDNAPMTIIEYSDFT